jgi:hypothetical protein
VAEAGSVREVGTGRPRRGLVLGWAVALAVGALGCSTTSFKSTWRNPTAGPITLQGQKVAALVMTSNETMRRDGEDALARELAARGVRGFPGYQLTGGKEVKDSEVLRKKLGEMGIDGAVVMRVIDTREEVNYIPGGPMYGSMWGYWDYGWAMMSSPGYLTTDTIVSVETLVYSLRDDKLLWGGVSQTIDPSNLDSFIKEIAKGASQEMKNAGVIAG